MKSKRIALALQGGGSHGAFTWGVLEAILADERLEIAGLSGTSAGGMNAAAVVHGLVRAGRAGAIEALEAFWRRVHELARAVAPLYADPLGKALGNHNLRTAPGMLLQAWFGPWLRNLSPYQLNPLDHNPLRELIEDFFDFPAIRAHDRCKLFLAATEVRTGRVRIFANREVSAQALLASSCVPMLFHAVEVDGEFYWDGGYIANPAIFPLIRECDTKDIVLVQLTRSVAKGLPREADAIRERFAEITLNACLIREIRAIEFVTRLIEEGRIHDPDVRRINLHLIKDEAAFAELRSGSALNTDWDFLNLLRRAGRAAGERFIAERYADLGRDVPFDRSGFADYL